MINKNLMFDIAVYFYQNYGVSMESIAFESHMVGFNVFINEKDIHLYIRFCKTRTEVNPESWTQLKGSNET